MRIADKMSFDQVKSNLSKNRSDMADLQNQAATQKRVTKPSDDPLAATRVLATRTEISGGQQFLKSVNQAKTFLDYSDQSLGELAELLMRAKDLALSQANDASSNKNTRDVTASEVEQLFSQAVQVGNRKLGDRFLFGGFKTTQAPFDAKGNYRGDSGEIKVWVNKEASVTMNIPGNWVFLGQEGKNSAKGSNALPAQNEATPGSPSPMVDDINEDHGLRDPASIAQDEDDQDDDRLLGATWKSGGVNIFFVLRDLQTGLRANDKESIQDSLDRVDEALAQVVLARSRVGSRVSGLNTATESLQKGQVDAKGLASNLEDADTFELVSDLNKTESTLKASLSTSGKLIQPSLLDFLR